MTADGAAQGGLDLGAQPLWAPGVDRHRRSHGAVADASEPRVHGLEVQVRSEEARDDEHEPSVTARDARATEDRIALQGTAMLAAVRSSSKYHARVIELSMTKLTDALR